MQMYLWDPTRDADLDEEPNYRPVHGGDDPSLVFHEYTHGLNNRLVTDAPRLRRAERRRRPGRSTRGRPTGTPSTTWWATGESPYLPDDLSAPRT